MRTIKFRGKSKITGKWLYGSLLHRFDLDFIYQDDSYGLFIENEVNLDTVGQFTGLHDKNGREIYEGDIICRKGLKIKHLIFYNEKQGRFMAALNGDTEDYDWCCGLDNDRWISSKEVIGNIHDNPELLKQQEL